MAWLFADVLPSWFARGSLSGGQDPQPGALRHSLYTAGAAVLSAPWMAALGLTGTRRRRAPGCPAPRSPWRSCQQPPAGAACWRWSQCWAAPPPPGSSTRQPRAGDACWPQPAPCGGGRCCRARSAPARAGASGPVEQRRHRKQPAAYGHASSRLADGRCASVHRLRPRNRAESLSALPGATERRTDNVLQLHNVPAQFWAELGAPESRRSSAC